MNESIAMLHGFGGHWLVMHPLSRRMRRRGYRVENWGYRSLSRDIDAHAERFRSVLESLDSTASIDRFHIVAHSMGSIITRVALQHFQPSKLCRVVMLCPPNHGSHVATRYAPWFGRFTKTLTEITDSPDSFVNNLSKEMPDQYEVGIVRATTDFVVRPESTALETAKDTIELRSFHSSIVIRKETAEAVDRFLQTGRFES